MATAHGGRSSGKPALVGMAAGEEDGRRGEAPRPPRRARSRVEVGREEGPARGPASGRRSWPGAREGGATRPAARTGPGGIQRSYLLGGGHGGDWRWRSATAARGRPGSSSGLPPPSSAGPACAVRRTARQGRPARQGGLLDATEVGRAGRRRAELRCRRGPPKSAPPLSLFGPAAMHLPTRSHAPRVREGEGAPRGARERHGPGLELGAPPPWPHAPPTREGEGEGAPRGAHRRHGHGPELGASPSPPDLRGSGRRRRRGREGERWEQEGERGRRRAELRPRQLVQVGPTWQAT